MGLIIVLGAAIGGVFGIAINQIGLGVAVGVAVGLAIGTGLNQKSKEDRNPPDEPNKSDNTT